MRTIITLLSLQFMAFAQPETGAEAMGLGSTVFKDRLYIAFQTNDADHWLGIASSQDGTNFTVLGPGIKLGSAPAMAAFKDQIYIAFQTNDEKHFLGITSSPDGSTFTTRGPGIHVGSAPGMAAFNDRLYIAFQANDPGHKLCVTSSANGADFFAPSCYDNILAGGNAALLSGGNASTPITPTNPTSPRPQPNPPPPGSQIALVGAGKCNGGGWEGIRWVINNPTDRNVTVFVRRRQVGGGQDSVTGYPVGAKQGGVFVGCDWATGAPSATYTYTIDHIQ
jgi:hypothetical protein